MSSDTPREPEIPIDHTMAFDSESKPNSGSAGSRNRNVGSGSGPTGTVRASSRIPKGLESFAGYTLVEMIGQGGMGRVYRATDSSGRSLAVKLLSADLSHSDDALERFKQEGKIASAINHPHCVFVHRADEENGIPFIAMELMEGENLKDMISGRGPLPVADAVRLILQCIDGLMEAHARGMIHRDIKPANCFLGQAGNVKIGDFGLARSLISDSELTRTGAFLGTPLYASPEQLLGDIIDERSDVYSLAATLYYLVAGKAPFESPNAPQVIAKIVSSDPPPFSEAGVVVPKAFEQIVHRGLARDRSKRFQTMAEFQDQLLPLISETSETASLPRRVLAFAVDYCILTFTIAMLMFWVLGSLTDLRESNQVAIYSNLVAQLLFIAYFFTSEWLFQGSFGKRLMNLRVAEVGSYGRMRWQPALLRSLLYVLIFNAIENLALLGTRIGRLDMEASTFLIGAVTWPGFLVGIAVALSSWWKTQKRQLLYEWLSGTETRAIPWRNEHVSLRLTKPRWELPFLEKSEGMLPARLGRFDIQGELAITDDSRWAAGYDKTIERSVWIQLLSDDAPSIETNSKEVQIDPRRRECVRKTRMRFIESGQDGALRWNAFVCPEGVPLSIWFDGRFPMPWPVTRQVLHDVANEMDSAEARPALPLLSPDRLWLDEYGKIVVGDAAVRVSGQPTMPEPTQPSDILSSIANLALPNRRTQSPDREHARANKQQTGWVAPWHATRLLMNLKSRRIADTASLRKELSSIAARPQTTPVSKRIVHAAVHWMVLFIPLLSMAIILVIPPSIRVFAYRRDSERIVNLATVFREPEAYSKAIASLDEGFAADRVRLAQPDVLRQIDAAAAKRQEQFLRSFNYMGYMERSIINAQNNLTEGSNLKELAAARVSDLRDDREPAPETDAVQSDFQISFPGRSVKIKMSDDPSEALESMIQAFRVYETTDGGEINDERTATTASELRSLYQFLVIALIVGVVWGGITRGGLTHWVTGLAIVRRDGRRAGIVRCLWRSLLFWIPPAVLVGGVFLLDSYSIDTLWWGSQLRRGLLILPLVYLLIAIRWPQRGPHDWLSGTYVVPR